VSTASKRARSLALPMMAVSLALHGAAWGAVARIRPPPVRERIAIEVVRRERPVPPPPRARREEPPPARARDANPFERKLPANAAPAPVAEPPPALASAPETAPASGATRALPKVGLSLASTVSSGAFAVGVGNTVYGRAEERAADPATVRPYSGGVPAARLSAQPRALELPAIPYPPDARRDGVEGQVVLLLRIDPRGAVIGVRVVDAPSHALARAAQEGARRFRFSAALLEGEPVETEIRFTYTFLLE
jgi:protein TonB